MDIIIRNSNIDKLIEEIKTKCSTYFDLEKLPQETEARTLNLANIAYYISGTLPNADKKTYKDFTEEKKLNLLKEINAVFEKYLENKTDYSETLNYLTAFYVSLAAKDQTAFKKTIFKQLRN